jgi:hypothetical protein
MAGFGPGLALSLIKTRASAKWRTDLLNASNTTQFNAPGNTIGTPHAGHISSTRFAANRRIQFVLKLFFQATRATFRIISGASAARRVLWSRRSNFHKRIGLSPVPTV